MRFNLSTPIIGLIFILHTLVNLTDQQQYNAILNQNTRPSTNQEVKVAIFRAFGQASVYKVVSYNATAFQQSFIKVWKRKINEVTGAPLDPPEEIQTIRFKTALVDFEVDCKPTHCFMVAVTAKPKKNVEFYVWQRFKFDLVSIKDSFARPQAVQLFQTRPNELYIVVAQEQLHLSSSRLGLYDEDEQLRFIGCAILKVTRVKVKPPKNYQPQIKYHQFIKLPFNPNYVHHITSTNQNNFTNQAKAYENHYLIFSQDQNWLTPSTLGQTASFIWSPLNDYFWPYKFPQGVTITQMESKPSPGTYFYPTLKFPEPPVIPQRNQTVQSPESVPVDWNQLVESCFDQLQRILIDRDLQTKRLEQTSQSLWRNSNQSDNDLTSISARVIVHGNVIVRGSMVESPQMTIFGGPNRSPAGPELDYIFRTIDSHSPTIVDNKLIAANHKLNGISFKLSKAVNVATIEPGSDFIFRGNIIFHENLIASKVGFETNGIPNADVKLNGIQFKHLQHEVIGLNGVQDIGSKVIFRGNVVADLLEIHGTINKYYHLKDAVDVNSNQVQIINLVNLRHDSSSGIAMELRSVTSKEVVFDQNATFNNIRLDEFITRDNRTQVIVGRKSFRNLAMAHLNVNQPNTPLNGFNISNIGLNAIRLRMSHNYDQIVYSNHMTFTKQITVGRLFINNFINRYINMSTIIHDSVKSKDMNIQQISGHKHFIQPLKIDHLTTEGDINQVPISQVFNLNPTPPLPDHYRYDNYSNGNIVMGNFEVVHLNVTGNLNVGLLNNVDITKRAIRRSHRKDGKIQFVNGRKFFTKRLKVVDQVHLMNRYNNNTLFNTTEYPMINGFDLRSISAGIKRQVQQPPLIFVKNLEIEGNFNLPISNIRDQRGIVIQKPRAFLGNYTECPLDLIKSKLIVGGHLNQIIDVPIKIASLRANTIQLLQPLSLNGIDFPNDFVVRSNLRGSANNMAIEPIFGHKYIENLRIAPSIQWNPNLYRANNIIFGSRSTINDISYEELQTFINQERLKNSTGETILQVMNVHGNIFAKRINGQHWPHDVLLKSIAANPGPPPHPSFHKRIYSPLIFSESSLLEVEDNLILKGPIQLIGRLNGVNLSEFSRSSLTYGDKDLLSSSRPIRNKLFLGGITVKGHFRSQGLIDNIDIDQMRDQVITIRPNINGRNNQIRAPKVFASDVYFRNAITTIYLNDMMIDNYLKRFKIVYQTPNGSGGVLLKIFDKKTITGALKINKYLAVQGLVNGIDFVNLEAKAISLSQPDDLYFNNTLTVDGDVFMDNLIIDEKSGILDGVKLINLIPLDIYGREPAQGFNSSGYKTNEIVILDPKVDRKNLTNGIFNLDITGSLNDCQISCSFAHRLAPPPPPSHFRTSSAPVINYDYSLTMPSLPDKLSINYPSIIPQQNPKDIYHHEGNILNYSRPMNFTYITRPPYKVSTVGLTYSPIIVQQHVTNPPTPTLPPLQPVSAPIVKYTPIVAAPLIHLEHRRPYAIQYEFPKSNYPYLFPMSSLRKAHQVQQEIDLLKSQMVSLNLIENPYQKANHLVVGFIPSQSNDLSSYLLAEQEPPHSGHSKHIKSFHQLDQIDFPFSPTIYHLAVGVYYEQDSRNVTSVFSSVGAEESPKRVSILPIESPNNAMFFKTHHESALFLVVSQDSTMNSRIYGRQCPRYWTNSDYQSLRSTDNYSYQHPRFNLNDAGIHVYLFQPLHNSSYLPHAFFDMYQTIDLPAVDNFEKFHYEGSTYILAISRLHEKIYLLLLRGYSGLQEVSNMDAPGVQEVKVLYTNDKRPILLIYQLNGQHRVMESVII